MTPNEVSRIIVDSSIKVHSALGAGLLEQAYKACLKHELQSRKVSVLSEVAMPVTYLGVKLDVGYRLDLLVERCVIVELKAVSELLPVHKAQLLTYLKLSRLSLGLLMNFNEAHLRDGIVRLINS